MTDEAYQQCYSDVIDWMKRRVPDKTKNKYMSWVEMAVKQTLNRVSDELVDLTPFLGDGLQM